jgi:type IV pilus assembly protein PilB
MVGEIRDRETAQIAVEAALTGHLVLSTLHTRDAPNAVSRLLDMGVEPFLLASAIDCVVAQRLARKLCDCKKPTRVEASIMRDNGFDVEGPVDVCKPNGCDRCNQTGYRGRVGIFEILTMNEEIRSLVLQRASADEIAALAVRQQSFKRLREDGLEKVRLGLTSPEEVLRVTAAG